MTSGGAPPAEKLRRARRLIDERCCDRLDVEAIASSVGLSRFYFSRQFSVAFGVPPHRYLAERRLERAAALLRDTDASVEAICATVGWQSVGSFTTKFTRAHGQPPTAYRREQRRRHGAPTQSGVEKRTMLPEGSRTAQSRTP